MEEELLLEHAAMARVKLGVSARARVVYYACEPHGNRLSLLLRIGTALASLKEEFPGIVLVVSPSLDDEAHREILWQIRISGIRIVQNGLYYLQYEARRSHFGFRPSRPASAEELLCLCAESGLVVIGDGEGSREFGALAHEMIVPRIIYRGESMPKLRRQFRRAFADPSWWILQKEKEDANEIQGDTITPSPTLG